jgi:hypothetical protein
VSLCLSFLCPLRVRSLLPLSPLSSAAPSTFAIILPNINFIMAPASSST